MNVIPYIFALIGFLMLGHLGIIAFDLRACDIYFQALLEQGLDLSPMAGTGCSDIEKTYQEAVDKYLSIALALAGGGTAGIALGRSSNK